MPRYNKTTIRIDRVDGMVVFEFDSPVAWVGMTTEQAIEIAESVLELAELPVNVLEEAGTLLDEEVQCRLDED